MSDLQQEIQQANQSDSEKETSSEGTESANSDQEILGNNAVREILGFAEAPSALSGRALGVYNHHVDRTPDMMVGLTANQRYDMGIFIQTWEQNRDRYEEVSAAIEHNLYSEVLLALASHSKTSVGSLLGLRILQSFCQLSTAIADT